MILQKFWLPLTLKVRVIVDINSSLKSQNNIVNIRPDEICNIIRHQIYKYNQGIQVANISKALQVSDGIAIFYASWSTEIQL